MYKKTLNSPRLAFLHITFGLYITIPHHFNPRFEDGVLGATQRCASRAILLQDAPKPYGPYGSELQLHQKVNAPYLALWMFGHAPNASTARANTSGNSRNGASARTAPPKTGKPFTAKSRSVKPKARKVTSTSLENLFGSRNSTKRSVTTFASLERRQVPVHLPQIPVALKAIVDMQ